MWHSATEHLDEIREMGYNVYYMEDEADELPCDPAIIDCMICCKPFMWHSIDAFKNLKWIQTESVGYDRIGFDECLRRGIKVYNCGNAYAVAIAEYTIAHLLYLYQGIGQELENAAVRGWAKGFGVKRQLSGSKILIIGSGNIAQQTARRLRGWDCEITAISHTPRESEAWDRMADYSHLHDELATADIVVLAAAPTTLRDGKLIRLVEDNLIGAEEFACMKETATFVNVARGVLVDKTALVETLNSRPQFAAILDVYGEEPLNPNDPIWSCKNAFVTAHHSYYTDHIEENLWNIYKERLQECGRTGA